MSLSLILKSTRLEAYFHTCDELLHMWAHAEDLDTLEFTLMQIVTYIAGPVSIPTNFMACSCCLYRLQEVSTDLADEVHVSPFKNRICLPYVRVGQLIAHYETAYAPFNRHRLAQIGNVLMNVS